MTDGIIQEIFNPIINDKDEWSKYIMKNDIIRLLEDIEQELIEKIKQEFTGKEEDDYLIHRDLVINKLIGDNQE